MKRTILFILMLSYVNIFAQNKIEPLPPQSIPIQLNLREAYDLAIKESKDLYTSRIQLQLFNEALTLQARKYFPQFSFNYSNQNNTLLAGRDTSSIRAGISIKQLVFDGGQNGLQDENARIESRVKSSQLRLMERQLINTVWDNYFLYVFLLQKSEMQKELFDLSLKQHTITEKEYELGKMTEISFLESEIKINQQALGISETELQLTQQDFAFRKLIGIEDEDFVFTDTIDESYAGIQIPEAENRIKEMIEYALVNNDELQKMRIQIVQSEKQLQLADLSFLPHISLEGTVNMTGEQFPLQQPEYSLSLQLQFPNKAFPIQINAGITEKTNASYGTNHGSSVSPLQDLQFLLDKKSAQLSYQNIQFQYNETLKDIDNSIRSQLHSLKQMRARLQLTKKTIAIQERKLKLSSLQWEKGLITTAEFIETQMEFQNMKISLLEGIFQLMQTERQLELSIGMAPGELAESLAFGNIALEENF